MCLGFIRRKSNRCGQRERGILAEHMLQRTLVAGRDKRRRRQVMERETCRRISLVGARQEASLSFGAAPSVRALAAGEAFMCLKASMMSIGNGKTMVEAFLLLMSLMVCR